MQELRFVAVSEDGSYAVLAVPGRSGRFILPIDERLRAVAQGQTTRLAQYEIEVESPLRPKEIQARIRAGETAEEIADAAGIPVERVRWFEGPVLAERAYIADQAQAASVRRAGDSGGPGPRLGDIVPERLTASGAAPEDGQWDSRKRGDGNWQVTLTFPSGGRLHVAEWVFDSRRRHVMPDDDNAARLSLPESELPPEPVSLPGEATVTPLAPRLGAAAGMGGGGMAGGGFGGGGSGVGVRSFRPERSVIPDRSLGGDRSLADRPLSPPSAPVHAPAAASTADRPVMPERPAMSHSPAAPPAPTRPAHHDPAPEPTVYRAPAPEQRAPEQRAPEQRAPDQPTPAGAVPVSAPPYVFEDLSSPAGPAPSRHVVFEDPEPAFHDEQLELAPASASASGGTAANTAAPVDPVAPARATPPADTSTTVAASTGAPATPPLPLPSEQPEERLRQPQPASAREFTPPPPAEPQPQQTRQPDPAAAPQQVAGAVAAAPAQRVTEATRGDAPAQPEPATAPQPATMAPAELVSATAANRVDPAPAPSVDPEPEPAAASAASAASAAKPEPTPAPEPAPAPAAAPPAQAESDQAESAEDQSARQRAASKKSAKGRRSSVPSWDEIMLGSSRQRD
jgi:hypothetical protein